MLRTTQALTQRLTVPVWARPAMGGLGLGLLGVVVVNLLQAWLGPTSHGLGVLGGGYGAAQLAITGGPPMPSGWTAVELLVLLASARMLAASLTIGTGGSAGDFAPSMVIGGLVGGAFGHAAALLLHDPRIDPGAFALVGMGTFYGGLAHVPVSSLILVSEMAGSYDLLVPLMLAEGIAFVMLRNHLLYSSQVRTQKDSPVHGVATEDVGARPVSAALTGRAFVTVSPADLGEGLLPEADAEHGQAVFPVVEASGLLRGLLLASSLRALRQEPELMRWARVVDLMQPPLSVRQGEPLRQAAQQMLAHHLRALPVVDGAGRVVGLLDEDDLARVLLAVPGEK
jgi:CIC family chloride channel protein